MSHGQPNKPQLEDFSNQEPIKYGDVFKVTGELATELISPHDADTMTAAETRILGQPQRGSPAAVMQAAAAINEASVLVGRHGMSEMAKDHGITVIETTTDGHRIITEAVGGQILGRRVEPEAPVPSAPMNLGSTAIDGDPISIGEALEAAALSVEDKPVDQNDADAISVAEIRATGEKNVRPGGVGESAQSAATLNNQVTRREDIVKLSDVLTVRT